MGDLGFSEAYMYGEVECDDLLPVFLIFIHNRESLQNLDSNFSWLFSLPQRLTSYRFLNTLSNSRSNISAHYDLSNDMFSGMHAPTSEMYLCPSASPPPSSPPDFNDELHAGQILKLQHITRKACILPGHRILEIGSGWGALALHIAQGVPDTQIDTLTLSAHQHSYVTQLIEKHGLEDRVRVHLMDYREIPTEWTGRFDRVVSVEMLEAVGKENYETYWSVIDHVLKEKDAVGVVQVITIPEGRFDKYEKEVDFIRKWVFPGGLLPTLSVLHATLTSATSGRLLVDSVSNIGPHYARTLREWRRRFIDNFHTIEEALRREHPGAFDGPNGQTELQVFWRKWICYFCYCEVGFTTRLLNDHVIAFTREANGAMGCNTFE
ncbi:cyclopropane-fatty-acyl-phospholipid synthase [Heterobasidion irregulare TC 32-1]|uniref:Cyclopropane-fatty-acyl-phospholipid synthase n=1 Tax=Heterobasidion irregulare (strain TC 32-1) TaxID=747525 RepID=W4K914_HETIT|nr:cyclopropane-fatty-acyl-phospholipid synthase [Heterobasidion irregulare TC 32-1]ETW81830.1 cyclopropane-fatty-acyl-phospholipid synthase [Heterobasidion irregulare TC 32-1]